MLRNLIPVLLISLYILPPAVAALPTPASAESEVWLNKPDDSRIIRIIDGFKEAIIDLCHGMVGSVGKVKELWKELKTLLREYCFGIDQQIQSSKCHNESCTEYGARTRP